MSASTSSLLRRHLIHVGAVAVASLAFPTLASSRRALPPMTEGPFYPSLAYRARSLDWDADLTTVQGRTADGQPRPRARGEHLDLFGSVIDTNGRIVDSATVEIWQCDVFASYRHPRGAAERIDEGFQGFGSSLTDAQGAYRFRSIRPVAYPGRTPHIHVRVRHPSFGETTSQLFVKAEPGNGRDAIYRSLSEVDRAGVDMVLQRAPADFPVMWLAERSLVVGA